MDKLLRGRIVVCMASFNGERFIERQINCILSEIGVNDVLLIADDGSSDSTIEVINRIADPRIRLVLGEGGLGPVRNFERVLRKSLQFDPWCVILADQDDEWISGRVERCSTVLSKGHALVVNDCVVIDEEGVVVETSFFALRGSRGGIWNNLYRNGFLGCCMGFRIEVVKAALPFPSGIYMHDVWIGLIGSLVGTVVFDDAQLVRYRRHQSNVTPFVGRSNTTAWWKVCVRLVLIIRLAQRSLVLKFRSRKVIS